MIDAPSPAEYARIARRRIFFGHRSVGANLMKGVSEMYVGRAGAVHQILETNEPENVAGPGIFHAQIGENGDPAGKTRAFGEILDAGFGDNGDIALHKYCYVDVTPTTDVRALFDEYRASVDEMRARHPRIVVAHVTIPLTTMETPFKALVKKLLGRPAAYREANAKRSEYNRLLLEEYAAEGTVFDLARLQSTRLDGTRVSQGSGDRTIYALARELTIDGGHLNALARPIFAAAFLRFLALLPLANGSS